MVPSHEYLFPEMSISFARPIVFAFPRFERCFTIVPELSLLLYYNDRDENLRREQKMCKAKSKMEADEDPVCAQLFSSLLLCKGTVGHSRHIQEHSPSRPFPPS